MWTKKKKHKHKKGQMKRKFSTWHEIWRFATQEDKGTVYIQVPIRMTDKLQFWKKKGKTEAEITENSISYNNYKIKIS